MGSRRFTPQNSFMLEQALDIFLQGFFYKIQAHHDISSSTNQQPTQKYKHTLIINNYQKSCIFAAPKSRVWRNW